MYKFILLYIFFPSITTIGKFMSAYFDVRTYAYNGGIIGAMYLGTVGRLRYSLNVGSRAANPPPLDAS